MSMEDYIISQLYLKMEKLKALLDVDDIASAKKEIVKVLEELEKYGQDSKKVSE
jgi:hypothetical protein